MKKIKLIYKIISMWIIFLGSTSYSQLSVASVPIVELPRLHIKKNEITISGVSSGAFMATQFAIAHSQLIKGFASIAGGIYWCAQGDAKKAQGECMNAADQLAVPIYIEQAKKFSADQLIDDVNFIKNQKIYIFGSEKDQVIKPPASDKLYEFVLNWAELKNVKLEKSISSGHGFPTLNFGGLCNVGYLPWLLNCHFDTASEILKHFYGVLIEKESMVSGHLKEFNQLEFNSVAASMLPTGYVYIPEYCEKGNECRLHIALHGCQMNTEFIQDQFVKYAGYNEWAESNHIVILYPQAAKIPQKNPYGCWDWYGFTDSNYANKNGIQIQSLMSMVSQLANHSFYYNNQKIYKK